MSTLNFAKSNSAAPAITQDTIDSVCNKLDQLVLDLIALHDYVDYFDFPRDFGLSESILKTMAKSCAADINRCLSRLGFDETGHFEAHFGEV